MSEYPAKACCQHHFVTVHLAGYLSSLYFGTCNVEHAQYIILNV